MASAIEWIEQPEIADGVEVHMISGWRGWADGGEVSSALPQYLIDLLGARKIGHIKPDGFYLFQTPLSQAMFRPEVKFVDGYRVSLNGPRNDIYFWEDGKRALVIFVGDEPHMDAERYAAAFFEISQTLKVKRVASVGGVYAVVPYDKDRNFTCTYALPGMKTELEGYAVSFSNYEGGVSIGSYLNDRAEQVGQEYFTFYAFVPMYDVSRINGGTTRGQAMSIEQDHKAWHDAMMRLNHMFKLGLDLSDLRDKAEKTRSGMQEQMEALAQATPQFPLKEYYDKITADFVEMPFNKLDDVWQDALGDIFGDTE